MQKLCGSSRKFANLEAVAPFGEIIETRMNLKVSNITKLFSSMGLRKSPLLKVKIDGVKIMKTIQKLLKSSYKSPPGPPFDKLHNIENMHRIIRVN